MQSPGRTVAIVNQKGGAAKTTTAVNLAAALAELGHAVLLIDLDPQGSATRWLGADPGSTALTDVLLHEGRLDDAVVPTAIDRVELVPASEPLNAADHDLARVIGGQVRLRDALADIRRRDFVFLDCPPGLGLLVINALAAADEALIPVPTRTLELDGLVDLTTTIAKVQAKLNPTLRLAGVLACRVDRRTRVDAEVVQALRQRFGDDLLPTVIHDSVRFGELRAAHQPINHYDPHGQGAKEYAAVAHALLDKGVAVHAG